MNHLSIENALAYITGKVTEEESFRIEIHLAECDECARKVYGYNIIKANFDEIWDSWTARSHAQALFQARVAESVAAADIPPTLRKRIGEWLREFSQKTKGVIGVTVDSLKKEAKIIQEGLEEIVLPAPALRFALVPVGPGFEGFEGEGRGAAISVETEGPPWIRVVADPVVRKISVRTEILKEQERWPLIILSPKREGKAFVGEFRHPEDTDYLLCEFEDIPDGEYFLALEAPPSNEK